MRITYVLSILLLLALCAFLGCEQLPVNGPNGKAIAPESNSSSTAPAVLPDGNPQLLKKSGRNLMPVTITFNNDPTYYIQPDNGGPYIDQVSGVSAYIIDGGTGCLHLHTHTGGKTVRTLTFDFSHSVGTPAPGAPSGKMTIETFLGVQDLGSPTGFAQFNFGSYTLQFGVGSGTDPVQVSGGGPWTVTTYGTGCAKLQMLSKGKYQDVGYYYMPFSITAVAQ